MQKADAPTLSVLQTSSLSLLGLPRNISISSTPSRRTRMSSAAFPFWSGFQGPKSCRRARPATTTPSDVSSRIVQLLIKEDYGSSLVQFWNDVFALPDAGRADEKVQFRGRIIPSPSPRRSFVGFRCGLMCTSGVRRRRELAEEADCKVPGNGTRTNEHGGIDNNIQERIQVQCNVRCGEEKK